MSRYQNQNIGTSGFIQGQPHPNQGYQPNMQPGAYYGPPGYPVQYPPQGYPQNYYMQSQAPQGYPQGGMPYPTGAIPQPTPPSNMSPARPPLPQNLPTQPLLQNAGPGNHRAPQGGRGERLTRLTTFQNFKDTRNLKKILGNEAEELITKRKLQNPHIDEQRLREEITKQVRAEEEAKYKRETRQKSEAMQRMLKEQAERYAQLEREMLQQQLKSGAPSKQVWEINPSDVEVGTLLGEGAFGAVYKGRLHGIEVAIKKLNAGETDEETMASFKAEVQVMNNLRHPNVLLLMGASFQPNNMMIITELMNGGGVDTLIHKPKKGKELNFAQCMKIARDCALGMTWLHSLNPPFLHLDLKLANLLVEGDLDSMNFTVKVADFGLTQMKHECTEGMVGSPFYMAPEMLLESSFNEKVDVYSYSIVLWELVTKDEPYKDRFSDLEELIAAITLDGERPISNNLPKSALPLISQCWDSDPNKRPSFKQIISERRIEKIVIDEIFMDRETMAKKFWTEKFVDLWDVPLEDFWKSFEKYFNIVIGPSEKKVKAFKMLLTNNKNAKVSMQDFSSLLASFGPLKTGYDVLDAVDTLAKKSWFFAGLDTQEALQILKAHGSKAKGFYLVRFSSSTPGSYTISYVDKSLKVKHLRVNRNEQGNFTYEGTVFSSLDAVLHSAAKTLGFRAVCPGSPFHSLYAGLISQSNDSSDEYLNVAVLKN